MYPVLFKIGPFELRSYGVMLALGFLFGIIIASKRAAQKGLEQKFIGDLSIVVIISSIVGSRLFYVMFHTKEFSGHWLDAISPIQSDGSCGLAGLSMMGGVVLAIISGIAYAVQRKQDIYKVADTVAPSIALGYAFGRIGCFLNGCCFGLPTNSPIAVVFPPGSPAGTIFPNTPLIPTQLYASAFGFLLFVDLILIEKIASPPDGVLFGYLLIFYSVYRFIIDIFRFYEPNAIVMKIGSFNLTNNQIIVIVLFFVGVIFVVNGFARKIRKNLDEDSGVRD